MKTKLLIKLMLVLSLCLAVLFTFSACKDAEIYAGSDDFDSYPDYWNDFNDDSGDIYIPNTNSNTSGTQQEGSSDDVSDTSSDDPTANFTDEDDESDVSSKNDTDTDGDGTPDVSDPDDDNDGINDDKDDDDNGNGVPDEEEKNDNNQGPLVFF